MSKVVLIGAGGHARMLVDALAINNIGIDLVIDSTKPDWIDAPYCTDDRNVQGSATVFIGIGGVTPDTLQRRLDILKSLIARGCDAPALIHPSAVISSSAKIGPGTQIAAGAIVQAFARVGVGVIVNSGAIIEHDAQIGDGSHIAPGAIILGGAFVGTTCMIGAGAVVLPQAVIKDLSLIRSMTRAIGSLENEQQNAH